MKFMKKLLSAAAVMTLTTTLQAMQKGWTTDFPAALKQAEKENKHLLVDFTGSDWCGWCIKLDKEVFSQEAFSKAVFDSYVPVYIDFPRDKSKMPPELTKQNQDLAAKYKINGYPTILILDSKGEIVVRTGYQAGGPEAYLKHLNDMKDKAAKNKQMFADAAKLKGEERIVALDKIISSLPRDERGDHMKTMKEIMEFDSTNKLGLKTKYALPVVVEPEVMKFHKDLRNRNQSTFRELGELQSNPDKQEEFKKRLNQFKAELAKDVEKLVVKLAAFDKAYQFKGLPRQQYLGVLVNCYRMQREFDKALKAAEEAIKIDPSTMEAKTLQSLIKMIERDKADQPAEKK